VSFNYAGPQTGTVVKEEAGIRSIEPVAVINHAQKNKTVIDQSVLDREKLSQLSQDKKFDAIARMLKDFAIDSSHKKDSLLLIEAISYIDDGPLLIDTLRFLLENGADVNFRESKGSIGALAVACRSLKGKTLADVVALLLSKGAKDLAGNSALGELFLFNDEKNAHIQRDVVKMLLDSGADSNAKIEEGFTVLMLICSQCRDGKVLQDIVKMFIEKSVLISLKDLQKYKKQLQENTYISQEQREGVLKLLQTHAQ
jgi:ankyrin repeat protein